MIDIDDDEEVEEEDLLFVCLDATHLCPLSLLSFINIYYATCLANICVPVCVTILILTVK